MKTWFKKYIFPYLPKIIGKKASGFIYDKLKLREA